MIPADVRILTCRDLFVTQASLTGESLPVEKFETAGETRDESRARVQEPVLPRHGRRERNGDGPRRRDGAADLSRHDRQHARRPSRCRPSFDQGVARFTWLMIRFIAVMVPLVFVINGLTKHDWKEAFFFARRRRGRPHARDAAR